MKQITIILVFLLMGTSILNAQIIDADIPVPDQKYIKYLDFRFENGAMLSNGTELGDQLINSSYYNAIDIRLGFQKTDPYDVYGNLYRRPIMGVGWYASTYHNNDIGNPTALYYFFKIPFKFAGNKRLTFSYGAAFGLSFNFKPFDEVENPANVFIGSYSNYYIHLEFNALYQLNNRLSLEGGVGFKHFSNGSFKLPNAGINLVPVTIGLRYKLGDKNVQVHNEKLPIQANKKFGLLNIGFIAASKNYEIGGENYFKGGLTINYLRQINHKYRFGAGVDYYNAAGADSRNVSDASSFSKASSIAVNVSWEWALNKNLYVPLAIAYYLHRNVENGEVEPYYLRAGIRYRFNNQMFVGGSIKAHGGRADIFEWTLGYTIGKNPNVFKKAH